MMKNGWKESESEWPTAKMERGAAHDRARADSRRSSIMFFRRTAELAGQLLQVCAHEQTLIWFAARTQARTRVTQSLDGGKLVSSHR